MLRPRHRAAFEFMPRSWRRCPKSKGRRPRAIVPRDQGRQRDDSTWRSIYGEQAMKLTVRDWFRRKSQVVTVEPRIPQARFPLHDHEFGEVVIVASGNGWHLWNEEPQFITGGEESDLAGCAARP